MKVNKEDTRELLKLKLELLKERQKFSLFLSLNTNCFFEYDEESNTVLFAKNESFPKLNGLIVELKADKFIKKTGLYFEDYPLVEKLIHAGEDGEEEVRLLTEDRDYIYCKIKTAVVIAGDDRQVIGCIHDDDDNHKKLEWLKEQSQLDPLTKFYNEQYMKEYTELFLCSEKEDNVSAFFLIDIDNFTRINDNIGRLFGDTVLTNIAEELRHVFPADAIAGRIGSDVFAVFVKNIARETETENFARRINLALLRVYAGGSGGEHLTGSIGVSMVPKDGNSYEAIFCKAQAALFAAKARGKGSIEFFNSERVAVDPHCHIKKQNQEYPDNDIINPGNNFVMDLTNYAQDLMDTTKDIYSAIHLLLERLVKEYKADTASIFEKMKGEKKLSKTYGYRKWDGRPERDIRKVSYAPFFEKNYFDVNGIREINNGKSAVLLSAFYEEGAFRGIIILEDKNTERTWTTVEKKALVSLTRIISFHLLRLRVTEKIQERLEHMKNYDALTGMPTLHKFKKIAAEKLKKDKGRFAVVYSDIGNFKFINDMYGYQFGDRILYDFALAIAKFLPEGSISGRISADNFVALVPFANEKKLEKEILYFGEKFHDDQKIKHIATNLVVISGACVLKEGETDISAAVDNANTARKSVKGSSSAVCCFYSRDMEEKIRREQEISNEMEDALRRREFVVYLQPKVALAKETLAGAEALVRWNHKSGELIPPDVFIPLFERNGFIVKLDYYVYEEVCRIIHRWMEEKAPIIPISVNVSRVHLNEDDFVEQLKNMVDHYQIPPEYIELELTESVFINNTKSTISIMRELKDYGFSVSIDDFGAGYSSLTLLKDMASDVLKLDKEFFRNDEMQKEEQIIVSSIVNMAKQLDMKVISEGIETEKQTRFLKDIECDMVQGYYYAKPMPIDQFEEFMREAKK